MWRARSACLLMAISLPALGQVAQPYCPPNNLYPNCPNNIIEQKKQEEARRRAYEEAQRQVQIRAQQEAAQKAALQRAQQEAAQKAALQRAQQEAAQKAAQQRAQQEAVQKAAQQRAQQEAAQKAALQRAQEEAAQKAALQRTQQEAAQKAVLQRAQQEAAQKAALQRAQQEAAEKAAQRRAQEDAARQASPQLVQKPVPATPVRPAPLKPAPVQQAVPAAPKVAPQLAAPSAPVAAPPVASSQPPPAMVAPARSVALSPATTVVPRSDRPGYTINQRNPDGSNLVVRQTLLANGNQQVTAYRQIDDRQAGTSTRIYLNGYRVTTAPTYQRRTTPGQATFIRYSTGLQAATLPGGKPLYKEQFVTVRTDGVERRTIQRTVYMVPSAAGYVPVKTQVVQVYDVVQVYRRPVYVYRPVRYVPAFFVPFAVPFASPLIAGPRCMVCPPPVVAFEAPQAHYGNSYDLLADLQIAGPLADDPLLPPRDASGNLPGNPAMAAGFAPRQGAPADPELASLRSQVDDLQREVDEKARDSGELQAALAQTALRRTAAADPPADAGARMKVPERVREVMRKQVRLSIAQHQNGNPLLLSDIAESGFARIFVFQASAPIEVEDVRTGAPCTLAAGDLAEFQKVPDGSSAAAPMSVIASRPGHCEAGQVVHVRLEDLQDMLNAFSQRVEENMKKLNSCLTARGGCMRT